jgi:23S rRNA (adenine2030-N6)-methyltransferase
MLSYQHIYHAGNFADVQKHAILVRLLQLLALKPQKFAFLDTHAGRGLYDLGSAEAQKTGEFNSGVLPFWTARTAQSPKQNPLADYLKLVAEFNNGDALTIYPGSAKIAHKLMRATDRLLLVERHPGEFEELQKSFAGAANVTLAKEDGFQYLVNKVPFAERRGLVLVDPSYEIKTEYTELPKQLRQALKRWPQGQFMIWYPMLSSGAHEQMLLALRKTEIKDVLVSEIRLEKPPQESFGMYGSGIIIINPPFGFEATLDELTQYIATHLPGKANGDVFWLNNRQINPETGMLAH